MMLALGSAQPVARLGVLKMGMRKLLVACAATLAGVAAAPAQPYPSRPITMLVPLAPGGAVDTLARILAEHMRGTLGEPVVIENVSGAGGTVGLARVARAAPDGYTLSIGNWASHVGASLVYPVHYELAKDFEPIALLTDVPHWMVARTSLPAKDLSELLAWLKANPDRTAATVGAGSGSHLCGIYLQGAAGISFQFVPYRGGAPAMQDLVGGRIDLMCDLAANSLPLVRSGQIKAYAVMAKARYFAAPDVPTADEAGAPGIYVSNWHALWAPKGVPPDIIARLSGAVMSALADPTVRQRIADLGMQIVPRDEQTPAALADFQRSELEKWTPVIRAAGIKPE
jgi:tripartite-type tricarboxylate transporter receptor subunit TctC